MSELGGMAERVAYKVLTAPQWQRFETEGRFAGAPVDLVDGFIHLSASEQVTGTVEKHFAGQDGLVIAAIDLAMLGAAVKWEESRGGALFPHVYAALPLASVVASVPLERESDGTVRLP